MANFVKENVENIRPRHYLLLANKGHHWFNAYPGVIADYRSRYGDDFCLVLWRSGPRDDAYVVPYAQLKRLFVESNLVGGPKKTLRWHGTVKNDYLALLGRRGEPVPVRGLHNAFALLAIGDDNVRTPSTSELGTEIAEITFGLERDLQTGLRQNIAQLERGLTILDGGSERLTGTGKIDITARDSAGRTVVIELKAGKAMPEALAQLLAYVAEVSDVESRRARGILVAGDFHPRLIKASAMVEGVQLVRYRLSFAFERIGERPPPRLHPSFAGDGRNDPRSRTRR
jgi:hypothetical protein